MAENKKSFILYCDQIHTFEGLDDEEAGRLIKHIFRYVNDQNPEPADKITKIAFEPIKHQMKRDLVKYETKREQWSFAGKASAESKRLKRKQEETNLNEIQRPLTSVKTVQRPSTVSTVNDTVNVTVTVNDNKELDISEKNAIANATIKKNLLEDRKVKFKEELKPYLEKYGADMLNKFFLYWTESNKTKSKMKFEMEKTFEVNLRLVNWASRNKDFEKHLPQPDPIRKQSSFEELKAKYS